MYCISTHRKVWDFWIFDVLPMKRNIEDIGTEYGRKKQERFRDIERKWEKEMRPR